jgi:alpha-beta hydrolase superfamily lysophospholipase
VVDWGPVEDIRLRTSDGEAIGAWLVRGNAAYPCVVVTHGWGESRSRRLPLIEWLSRRGCTVLAITLRTHGDSSGEVNDFGWSARHDVIAAIELLERVFPGRPIVVCGQSLGSAAALFAAGDLGERVNGYFLEQPYKDLATATRCRLETHLPPGLDRLAYSGMRLCAPALLPVAIDRVSPMHAAESVPENVPVMIVAGSADAHSRLDDVGAVYDCVKTHGELVVMDGAGHVDLHGFDATALERALGRFLDQFMSPR